MRSVRDRDPVLARDDAAADREQRFADRVGNRSLRHDERIGQDHALLGAASRNSVDVEFDPDKPAPYVRYALDARYKGVVRRFRNARPSAHAGYRSHDTFLTDEEMQPCHGLCREGNIDQLMRILSGNLAEYIVFPWLGYPRTGDLLPLSTAHDATLGVA
jgi:hypothetical protein